MFTGGLCKPLPLLERLRDPAPTSLGVVWFTPAFSHQCLELWDTSILGMGVPNRDVRIVCVIDSSWYLTWSIWAEDRKGPPEARKGLRARRVGSCQFPVDLSWLCAQTWCLLSLPGLEEGSSYYSPNGLMMYRALEVGWPLFCIENVSPKLNDHSKNGFSELGLTSLQCSTQIIAADGTSQALPESAVGSPGRVLASSAPLQPPQIFSFLFFF